MPKITPQGISRKISISQIIEKDNVRTNYCGIQELADSIRRNGLLQPVVVRQTENDENGLDCFELIAGHRRLRAYRLLCESGEPYTQIDAVIKTGDKLILQLIENIQREDLNPAEREQAIKAMHQTGMSIKNIAIELSKTEDWVCSHLAASEVRETAENAGISTEGMKTHALRMARSIESEKIPEVVEKIKEAGGTQKAAAEITREFKGLQNENNFKYPRLETAKKEFEEHRKLDEVQHKTIDIAIVFDEINIFMEMLDAYAKAPFNKVELKKNAQIKHEACLDIIALLHRRF